MTNLDHDFVDSKDLVSLRHGPFLFGFGKKHTSMEMLAQLHAGFQWEHLKQIHSSLVVESVAPSDERSAIGAYAVVEADSHFTVKPSLAVVVKSADCVPVLIGCHSNDQPPAVCAIHAGWRGVISDIVQNSVKALLERGFAPTRMCAAIGPHIRLKSFEVGLDVASELKLAAKRAGVHDPSSVVFSHASDGSKRMIDLETIVRHQLMSYQIPSHAITSLKIDTLTNPEWASYRRDGANAGRNLSFAVVVG